MKILIIGKGWIGQKCLEAWDDAVMFDGRIETAEDMLEAIDVHKPDAVLNAAGVTGKPNVDWCETHQIETIKGNTVLPLLMAEACQKKNVYMLHIGSGCVFYGSSPHDDGKWRADDFANPTATYSRAKYAADLALMTLPNVGIARIRMPIEAEPGSRNLIDKLASYPKVIDVENSVTIIDDMLVIMHKIIELKGKGAFHVVNKGTIKHRDIIDLYKKYVDPKHECEWIKEDELVSMGLACKGRSNNFLDISSVEDLGIEVPDVYDSMEKIMKKYAELIKK